MNGWIPRHRSLFAGGPFAGRLGHDRRGIALLLVVILLAALATLAVPFASSMRQQELAARKFKFNTLARAQADVAAQYARGHLTRSVESVEASDSATAPFDSPDSDSEMELHVLSLDEPGPKGVSILETLGFTADADGYESVLSLAIEDESGKVDLNSGSAWLIGNLLASTVTTERHDSGDTTIEVEATLGFPDSGTLMIGGEVIGYTKKTDTSFQGLQRGKSLEWGFASREPGRLSQGALVIDARAYVIAKQHLLVDGNGRTLPVRTATEMRSSVLAAAGAGIVGANEIESILTDLTVHTGRFHQEGWYAAQPLTADPEPDDKGGWILPIRFSTHYGMGSAVRVTSGEKRLHGHVIGFKFAGNIVPVVDVPLDSVSQDGAYVEVEERAPININTASFRVLVACFLGVSANPKDSVSLAEALTLADAVLTARRQGSGITSLAGYHDVLAAAGDLSSLDRHALFLNAQVPGHIGLRVGTTSFSFTSADRYTIDSSVKILGPASREVGAHRQREAVYVARPADVVWAVESQRDYREFVNRFGWMNLMSTGPRALPYEAPTRDRMQQAYMPYGQATSPSSDPDAGFVELTPSREWDGETDQVIMEHFAGGNGDARELSPDNGHSLGLGGLFQPMAGGLARLLAPGRIEFWIRPSAWQGSDVSHLVDLGENEYHNRIAILYDSSNDWLVFRMGETALGIVPQTEEPTLLPAWAEVRFPLENIGLEPDHWHHLIAEWSGTDYGQMALLVDGVAHIRGDGGPFAEQGSDPEQRTGFTYATTDPAISPLTYLTADVSEDALEIEVADASAFGLRGLICVGGELMAFDNTATGESNTLTIIPNNFGRGMDGGGIRDNYWDSSTTDTRLFPRNQRALGGTRQSEHATGEPVTPGGYSARLAAWLPPSPTQIAQAEEEEDTNEEEGPTPTPTGPETANFSESWDIYADPHTYRESTEGVGGLQSEAGFSHSGTIVEDEDTEGFGIRSLYAGGAIIDPPDYTRGYLGRGGHLVIPLAYALADLDEEQRGRLPFTLPDVADIEPADECEWVRVWHPGLTSRAGAVNCELADPSLVGSDPITLLEEAPDVTLGETENFFVRSSRTGSWPVEGYAVIMSVSWQGAPAGPGGRMMGGGRGLGDMCVPWIDAYQSVISGITGAIGGQFGVPTTGSELDETTKAYEYVYYNLGGDGGGGGGLEDPGGGGFGGGGMVLERRGLFGTAPLEVITDPLELPYQEVWAFPISVRGHYDGQLPVWEAYPPSGFVQIEDEWIEYYFYRYDQSTGSIDFITPVWEKLVDSVVGAVEEAFSGNGFNPQSMRAMGGLMTSTFGLNRGQANTNTMPHPMPADEFAFGTEMTGGETVQLIPAFLVRGNVGYAWDSITIVDEWNDPLQVGGTPIAANVHWRHNRPGQDDLTWVALDGAISRGVLAEGRARILKFPSGETPELYDLPNSLGPNLAGGGSARMGAGPWLGLSPAAATEAGPYQPPTGEGLSGESFSMNPGFIDLSALDDIPGDSSDQWSVTVAGQVDEIRVRSALSWATDPDGEPLRLTVVGDGATPTYGDADVIGVNASLGVLQALGLQDDGGLVKIGDELIAFRGAEADGETTLLTGCHRGFLGPNSASGTDGVVIGDGQPLMLMKYADLSQLDTGMGTSDAFVPILSAEGLRPQDGHVLIDSEIVGYTSAGDTILMMPARVEDEDGLYRGRFGTRRDSHEAGAIVYELPFRYWDRYAEEADDPSMAFVQVVRSAPEASWKSFYWEEEVPGAYLDIVCLGRFGGEPGWSAEIRNQPGGLYEFGDASGTRGTFPTRSQFELRFMMRYLPGAYESSHDWKDTPRLKSIFAQDRTRAMVLDHEELR